MHRMKLAVAEDIVTRLNNFNAYPLCRDAVAEIERLRAAGDALAVHWEEMSWTGEPEYIAWKEARRG